MPKRIKLKQYDALVFLAHPDDERRVSGTIAHLTGIGLSILIVCLTAGEKGTYGTRSVRKRELADAAQVLGADVHFMNFRDTSIFDNRMSRVSVARVIRQCRPRIVFAPYVGAGAAIHGVFAHPDHRSAGALVTAAVTIAGFKKTDLSTAPHRVKHVLYFLLPKEIEPNVYIPISDAEMEQALRAAEKHVSQKAAYKGKKPYPLFLVGLREFSHLDSGLQELFGCSLTEHFLSVPPVTLRGESLKAVLFS